MSDTQLLDRAAAPTPSVPGYTIIEKYAETSRSEVWSALQVSLDRTVTLWMLKRDSAADPGVADHFERVARAVSRIRHPNFVQVIDIARLADGVPYMVLENVEGASITSVLHAERRLDPKRAASILLEIAKGLDFAWKQCGFIHRNLKPDTLLLSAGDAVKITNYNTAALVRPGENPLAYDGGMVVGTPNYASPEQIECLRTIDFHTDMYSAGALFYQMVTGLVPFGEEKNQMQVLELQRSGTLPDPRTLVPTVPPAMVHIMQRMMAKSPEERYTWWQDVIEDLQRVLSGRPPYIPSGSYVPPLSTIAISSAGAAASEVAPGARKPPRRILQGSAPASGTTAPRTAPRPGCLTRLLGLAFVVVVVGAVVHLRIQDLERPAAPEAVAEPAAAVAEPAVPVPADESPSEAAPADSGAEVAADTSAETPTGEPLAETQVEPAPEAPPSDANVEPTGESTPAVDVQAQIVLKIYEALKTLPFTNAVVVAKQTITNAVAVAKQAVKEGNDATGIDLVACRQIWDALGTACSVEDMLGHSVASSPGRRNISVSGEEFVFSTLAYAGGELVGQKFLPDGTGTKPHRIRIADMTPQEQYDLSRSTVVSTNRADLLSRAFLALKVGDAGGFSLFIEKHKLDELKPFMDHVGK